MDSIKTEKEKMLAGELYDSYDPELSELREKIRNLVFKYNKSSPKKHKLRQRLLFKMLGSVGTNSYIEPPVYFDYGFNVRAGDLFYANFNTVFLDVAPIKIGNNVMFGPNVTVATPFHPLIASQRNIYFDETGSPHDREYARPIIIGNGVWIAAGVVICGGVTIGDNAVIGAGSVVTKDIPPNVVAAGVPCKVIRKITEADTMD